MYIAQKPCKFAGVSFRIGDTIDDSYLQPTAAPRLIKMGVIAAVDTSIPEKQEAPEQPADAADVEGPTPCPPSTSEKYTKNQLGKMTKAELLDIASELKIDADEEMTKAEIADLILEKCE